MTCFQHYPSQRAAMKGQFVLLTEELFLHGLRHMNGLPKGNKYSRIVFQNYFSSEEENYLLLVSGQWDSPDEDGHMSQWVDACCQKLSTELGAAPNFAPRGTKLQDLFDDEDIARLNMLKKKYDTHNFFSVAFFKLK